MASGADMRKLGRVIGTVLALGVSIQAASAQTASPDQASDYELVRKINSRRGYEIFLQTYPTGPFADLARKRLSEIAEHGRKTEPNWGDDIFIPRLMEKQRH